MSRKPHAIRLKWVSLISHQAVEFSSNIKSIARQSIDFNCWMSVFLWIFLTFICLSMKMTIFGTIFFLSHWFLSTRAPGAMCDHRNKSQFDAVGVVVHWTVYCITFLIVVDWSMNSNSKFVIEKKTTSDRRISAETEKKKKMWQLSSNLMMLPIVSDLVLCVFVCVCVSV